MLAITLTNEQEPLFNQHNQKFATLYPIDEQATANDAQASPSEEEGQQNLLASRAQDDTQPAKWVTPACITFSLLIAAASVAIYWNTSVDATKYVYEPGLSHHRYIAKQLVRWSSCVLNMEVNAFFFFKWLQGFRAASNEKKLREAKILTTKQHACEIAPKVFVSMLSAIAYVVLATKAPAFSSLPAQCVQYAVTLLVYTAFHYRGLDFVYKIKVFTNEGNRKLHWKFNWNITDNFRKVFSLNDDISDATSFSTKNKSNQHATLIRNTRYDIREAVIQIKQIALKKNKTESEKRLLNLLKTLSQKKDPLTQSEFDEVLCNLVSQPRKSKKFRRVRAGIRGTSVTLQTILLGVAIMGYYNSTREFMCFDAKSLGWKITGSVFGTAVFSPFFLLLTSVTTSITDEFEHIARLGFSPELKNWVSGSAMALTSLALIFMGYQSNAVPLLLDGSTLAELPYIQIGSAIATTLFNCFGAFTVSSSLYKKADTYVHNRLRHPHAIKETFKNLSVIDEVANMMLALEDAPKAYLTRLIAAANYGAGDAEAGDAEADNRCSAPEETISAIDTVLRGGPAA